MFIRMKNLKRNISATHIFLIFFVGLFSLAGSAAELTVTPSATEITEDENISLIFRASVDDYNGDFGDPEYSAPDFDEINTYSGMQGIQSTFINGKISVKKTNSMTVVLHPKKIGKLKISNISISINGKKITSEDIVIDVSKSGSQTGASRSGGYPFGSPSKSDNPRAGVHQSKDVSSFFIKTEPNKLKVYKGEQIILTYAIYTQVPILGIQVERYPTVPGFLKEDIEIPLINNRLQYQRSVVGGREYNRAVLAQYAVFPLKEGSLAIDPLSGKFSYKTRSSRSAYDDDDPFGMLNQFMNTLQTSTATKVSDRVNIEVLPLPADGQPASFTGLVGDFDITVVSDKYSLKTGEPLNVKVKVEGRGHAGSLEHLNVDWPKDFELYEDKSSMQFMRTGTSERIFDFMLIPRAKGKFKIPAIELSMFNPQTKHYVTKKSLPIDIDVLEGAAGSMASGKKPEAALVQPKAEEPKKDLRYWLSDIKDPDIEHESNANTFKLTALLSFLLVFGTFGFYAKTTGNAPVRKSKGIKDYEKKIQELVTIGNDPGVILASVESILSEILRNRYGVSKGSLVREDLKEELFNKNAGKVVTEMVISIIERCENLRFAPVSSNANEVRVVVDELSQLLKEMYS